MKKSKFQFQNPRISSFLINENKDFDIEKLLVNKDTHGTLLVVSPSEL